MRTVATALALVLLWACTGRPAPAPTAGTSAPVDRRLAALDLPSVAAALPLSLQVPEDGAVVPWTFPPLRLAWDDRAGANLFRVRLFTSSAAVVAEAVVDHAWAEFSSDEWQRLRDAVGEGGAFQVAVTAASVLPDGTLLRGPATVTARARFSGADEHPTGHVVYGWKMRPTGSIPAPVHPDWRGIALMSMDMHGQVEPLFTEIPGSAEMRRAARAREVAMHGSSGGSPGDAPSGPDSPTEPGPGASTGPEAVASRSVDFSSLARSTDAPAWSRIQRGGDTDCIACHTLSRDGTYVAMNSSDNTVVPEGWVATQGVLFVVREADRKIVRVKPGATFSRFHPTRPGLMVYSAASNSTGVKQRLSVYRVDLRVVDVETGDDRVVPGADDPTRCEFFPEWSPDGHSLVFSRSAPFEPCEGGRGQVELAVVPWNDGAGGEARPLLDAASGKGSDVNARFSADGRWIVFTRFDRGFHAMGRADLWIVPAGGGTARELPLATDAMESWHAFSPDGRWLAFVSNRERVDRPRLHLARFFADGTVSPALPFPGADGRASHVHTFDWGP